MEKFFGFIVFYLLLNPSFGASHLTKERVISDLSRCVQLGNDSEEECYFRNLDEALFDVEFLPTRPKVKIMEGYFSNINQLEAIAIVEYEYYDWEYWDYPNGIALSYIYQEELDAWEQVAIEPFFSEVKAKDVTGDDVYELWVHLDRCRMGDCKWHEALYSFKDEKLVLMYERYDRHQEKYMEHGGNNIPVDYLMEGDTLNHTAEIRYEDLDGDGINELIEHHELDLYLPDPDSESGFDSEKELVDRFYKIKNGRYQFYKEVAD